ncbi:MAG: aspartate aminotransferase [Sphingobacteriaceae bacterium]|nr:aspartate aminotransferase [Sphingobacteriaceae bacterium]
MPTISQRGIAMPPSPIRKLVPFAEGATARGVKIYHLNIGQPDIDTAPGFIEAIQQFDGKVLEYSHSAGLESYRRKYAQRFQERNIGVDHNDIIITTGGSEAIIFGMMSCLNPGDEVIIPEPFYANYNGFAQMAGVKVVPITTHIENGFALPSVKEFEKLINERTKAIVICNPNNPTGTLYTDDELMQLRDLVLAHDLYLFADEVYRMFSYSDQPHRSILSLPGMEQHAIVVESVSKIYSACGARIGALVTENKEVIAAAMKFAQARLSPPTLEQVGAMAALDAPQSYFDDVRSEYISRRDLVVAALQQMPGVTCPNPGGAFYCVVQLPIDDSDHFCQWMLESFSYEQQTVMMAPATGFYASAGLGKNQVRIAYVLNKHDLSKAMECLAIALQQYPGRTHS